MVIELGTMTRKFKAFIHLFMTSVLSDILCSKGNTEAAQAGGFACRGQSLART